MTMHIHSLTGCAPTPLAWYLKGLGVLRLVAEQRDPAARGWWQNESFRLATKLNRGELERFFLLEYAPTPIIAPWNKGSGFVFAGNNPSLGMIEGTTCARFRAFRGAVADARVLVGEMGEADAQVRAVKAETKARGLTKADRERLRNDPGYKRRLAEADRRFGSLKEGLIPGCRRAWRGPHLDWMSAAVVLDRDCTAKFPALLGSGGNDGKNDFTKQYMQCLLSVIDASAPEGGSPPTAAGRLADALFSGGACGASSPVPVGQFLPGSAGGANMSTGSEAAFSVNPWDYILLLEGAVLFSGSVVRRTAHDAPTAAAAPFAIHPAVCGYPSGGRERSRDEQWMPLWDRPTTLPELRRFLADGRVQLGRHAAARPLEFARSLARLGVGRGITAFQRFGYLERNGQSNLAVPLGRWQVASQPHQELLDDLDRVSWLAKLQRAARDEHAPSCLAAAHRAVDEAVMAVCAHGGEPGRWQALLLALADVEGQLVHSGKFAAGKRLQPAPPLSPGWLTAADDGSPEFRLAVALGLQAAGEQGSDPIRHHWLPLQGGARRFAIDASGLRQDSRVVCHGLDPERDLIALVARRLVEGANCAVTRLSLVAAPGYHARLADIAALLAGSVDLGRTICLARAFMAMDRRALPMAMPGTVLVPASAGPPPLYGLLRLACLPWPLHLGPAEIRVRCDPSLFARLSAGDLASAGDIAIRRLKAVGLSPVLRHVFGDPGLARRLAVSLAFPIRHRDAAYLAERLTKPQSQE